MRSKLLEESDGRRTFALVFATGDEALDGLSSFARELKLTAASFTAVGAFSRATLGYFDPAKKEYERIEVDEQVEVLTLAGDVALEGEVPTVHAHVVLGRRDGSAVGGHLLEAIVRPTLEVMLVDLPAHLRTRHDPETGLALIDF